ncbi:MAG TPA: 23S rRNA (adenine(2503)-C(2))-methyltransferase RlmN [Candidatus Pacearchaeota archaeon]|nr:23S rRNA (adenine(2503)-C(2))-methyltransferase RlmN [Candidatus Pacearchaeota archaeon]HQG09303.1 23S rRNA (adenine(2503)-C(2))-methyltransferase RlmN [Candidatus Pacearchaeota archaeon]HQH19952.1 23S rRNA (adenine(2503)-C(2))-methyltransferase RlmN [Candidatus Pacearchaeota archaeon]
MILENIEKVLKQESAYRLKQAQRAVFYELIDSWDEATNLSLALREQLKKECPLKIKSKIFVSKDKNTAKALINLEDGLQIETVLMLHNDKRATVCVSSQVGCPLGCVFCATGQLGFKRNLTPSEIIEQILVMKRYLKNELKEKIKLTNVVFMGMGEPFLNYENVWKAIQIINDKDGFNIGARKISISTAGIVEGIRKMAKEKLQVNLSISLHAPTDELRQKLMPIAKRYPLKNLLKAVDNYILQTSRKVMFEYVMLKGINDSMENAEQLCKIMNKPLYMVNLIAYNQTDKFKPSDPKTIKLFKDYLEKRGIFTTQRYEFGQDIWAACGQLAFREKMSRKIKNR